MIDYRLVNTVGLALTIFGCLLLFFFGLPPQVNPSGENAIIMEESDEAEIAKGRRYKKLGRVGIVLIALGSVAQIYATWISK